MQPKVNACRIRTSAPVVEFQKVLNGSLQLARKLAAKVSLATRIDALGDESHGAVMGTESRAYLEAIARSEQERSSKRMSGVSTAHEPYHFKKYSLLLTW